jgi:hypothetical protein
MDAEGAGYNRPTWLMLCTSDRGERRSLMTPEEHAAFESPPARVRISRDAPLKRARGMSWTVALSLASCICSWLAPTGFRSASQTTFRSAGLVPGTSTTSWHGSRPLNARVA